MPLLFGFLAALFCGLGLATIPMLRDQGPVDRLRYGSGTVDATGAPGRSLDADDQVPEGAAVFPLIPAELGINPLLLAVVHATVFLAGSDEEVVDATAADEAVGYLAGYRGGRPFVERFSHLLRVNPGHLARSEMFFTRYGGVTILFARFMLGLRTWASVLAGMSRMPFWTFQLYSSAGALIWALAVGAVGFYLGTNWALVQGLIRALGMGGLVGAAVLILAALLLRRRASHI